MRGGSIAAQLPQVSFSPSGKEGVVATIESECAEAGYAVGFTLEHPIFVERGELVSLDSLPVSSSRFRARLFWIGRSQIAQGGKKECKYTFRVHTSKVGCWIEQILAVTDSATLEAKKVANTYDIIECTIQTVKPVAFDLAASFFETNRFVLMDGLEIVGAGIILAQEEAKQCRWVVSAGSELMPDIEGIYMVLVKGT